MTLLNHPVSITPLCNASVDVSVILYCVILLHHSVSFIEPWVTPLNVPVSVTLQWVTLLNHPPVWRCRCKPGRISVQKVFCSKKSFCQIFLKFFFERATKIIFEAAISFLTFAFLVFFSCLEIVAKWFSWQRFGFLFHRCRSLLRSKKSPEQGQTFLLPDSDETCSRRISSELGRYLFNYKV